MESVPYIVQDIDGETGEEKDEDCSVDRFLLQGDLPVHHVEDHKLEDRNAAEDIRPVVQPCFDGDVADVSGQHVKDGEIAGKGLRETEVSGGGRLQRVDLRDQDRSSETSRHQGTACKLHTGLKEALRCHLPLKDHKAEEPDDQEHADHDRNVVIRRDAESQRDRVHDPPVFGDQFFRTVNDQRKQEDAVQPHHVPAVGAHIGGHRVKDPEKCRVEPILFRVFLQVPGHGEAAEAGLHDDHDRDELDHVFLRAEDDQPVQRAGEVICIDGGKIDAHADVPAVQKASAGAQFIFEFREKRRVLMIEICPEKALVPEGENASLDKDHDHDEDGNEKRNDPRVSAPEPGIIFSILVIHSE